MESVLRSFFVCLISVILCATPVRAQIFMDDFNRPNSQTVGNGWSTVGLEMMGILSNQAAKLATSGTGGIYRPFASGVPIGVQATLRQQNGNTFFGGRYTSKLLVYSDMLFDSGYGVAISQADVTYPGFVELWDGPSRIDIRNAPFSFGDEVYVDFLVSPNGMVSGTLWSGINTFPFSFGPHAIQHQSSSGFVWSTDGSDPSGTPIIPPRLDDLTISVVPAPSTTVLVIIGCLLGLHRRVG